jgi:low affinity Fe/Cu permease
MAKLIYALADAIARPLSFVIISGGFAVAALIGWILGLSDSFWTVVNLCISFLTMVIGQAVLVSSRRDGLATDLKLDHIIEALPRDNEAIGAEKLDAEEIQEKKDEVEERTQDEASHG